LLGGLISAEAVEQTVQR